MPVVVVATCAENWPKPARSCWASNRIRFRRDHHYRREPISCIFLPADNRQAQKIDQRMTKLMIDSKKRVADDEQHLQRCP